MHLLNMDDDSNGLVTGGTGGRWSRPGDRVSLMWPMAMDRDGWDSPQHPSHPRLDGLSAAQLSDACRHATTAAELLHRTPYATGTAHLRAFRAIAGSP